MASGYKISLASLCCLNKEFEWCKVVRKTYGCFCWLITNALNYRARRCAACSEPINAQRSQHERNGNQPQHRNTKAFQE